MISGNQSLQRRGGTVDSRSPAPPSVTLVTSGANVNGLIIRTCLLITRTGFFVSVTAGGAPLFYAGNGQAQLYSGPGLLVTPGQALAVNGNGVVAADADSHITYDLL